MRERIAFAGLLFFVATTARFNQAAPAPSEAEKAPAPQMTISLEHPILRENDTLPIHIVISNPSDFDLQNVCLEWTAPRNLEFESVTGTGNEIDIGVVPSQKGASTPIQRDLVVRSSDIRNEDYNLLFRLSYEWQAKDGLRHGVLTAEKPLKSAFLGTDSFAGVPLALAGFIVPGLLFWLALDWWKTPWRIQGPTLGDKTVYSVLVSMLLMAVVLKLPVIKDRFDITEGLSWPKLGALALLGGGVGVLVGGLDRFFRWLHMKSLLHPNDADSTLLVKLLRLNVGRNQPRTKVTLNTGQTYSGSVGGQSADHTFLVGWYRIHSQGRNQAEVDEIRNALNAGEFPHAAELAERYQFALDTQDPIYLQGANGAFAPTPSLRLQWANADVDGRPTVEVDTGEAPFRIVN